MKPEIEFKYYDQQTGAEAYLVIHNLVDGMTSGGVRLTPHVTIEEVRQLAFTMSCKFRIHDLKMGGAKCGIRVPENLSRDEKDNLLLRVAEKIEGLLRTNYMMGPDIGTSREDINKMYGHLGLTSTIATKIMYKLHRKRDIMVFIPDTILELIVSKFSNMLEDLTGYGVYVALQTILSLEKMEQKQVSVALQGLGDVGKGLLRLMDNDLIKVVKVSDEMGSLYNLDGLNIKALVQATSENGILDRAEYMRIDSNAKEDDRDNWYKGDIDVLIPAAIADAFNQKNRGEVNASIIIEAANIPMDRETDDYFHSQGCKVVPDFVANSGLVCSYGLIVSNEVKPYQSERIKSKVGEKIAAAVKLGYKLSQEKNLSMRSSIYEYWADPNSVS